MSSATSFQPVSTTKRHRASSQSSGSSTKSGQHVAHKSTRISASPPPEGSKTTKDTAETLKASSHPLLCTLPPTCNHRPTPLANTKELESHYATYHAHVCEQPGCGCVFPDARLLELHQTENHDILAAMRKERGEKIFACHLASCTRLFANPKGRRLHLISAHGYPKEYFFAVTNKGVGGLLKKWGEGASMIRGKWKPRDSQDKAPENAKGNARMDVNKETFREKMDVDEDDDSDEDDQDEDDSSGDEDEQQSHTITPSIRAPGLTNSNNPRSNTGNRMAIDQDPEATPRPPVSSSLPPAATPPTTAKPLHPTSLSAADSLASGFSALSLVPPSVRFGRGGRGGFVQQGGHQKRPSQTNFTAAATSEPAAAAATPSLMMDSDTKSSATSEQETVDKPARGGRGGGGPNSRGRGGASAPGTVEGAGGRGGAPRGRGGRGRGRGRRGY